MKCNNNKYMKTIKHCAKMNNKDKIIDSIKTNDDFSRAGNENDMKTKTVITKQIKKSSRSNILDKQNKKNIKQNKIILNKK